MEQGFGAIFIVALLVFSMVIFFQPSNFSFYQRCIRGLEVIMVALCVAVGSFTSAPLRYVGEGISLILILDLLIFLIVHNKKLFKEKRFIKKHKADVHYVDELASQNKLPLQAFQTLYLNRHHKFYLSDSERQWLKDYINDYDPNKYHQRLIFSISEIAFSTMPMQKLGVIRSQKHADKFNFKGFQQKLMNFKKRQKALGVQL